jgi:tetratricopeptide (TPR) repeat protein
VQNLAPEIVARLSMLEQYVLAQYDRDAAQRDREAAQRDRDFALLKETIRLVTFFSAGFGAIGLAALIASGWLAFRSMSATAAANSVLRLPDASSPADGALLPAAGASGQGMARVKASGRRFQSRVSDLEQRLSELENITGRASPAGEMDESAAGLEPVFDLGADEADAGRVVQRVIPRAAILVHKANALVNLGKLKEAIAVLDEAASHEPGNIEMLIVRGQVFEKLGRLGDALEAYERAVDTDQSNTSALLMKAGVLNRQERFNEALACYERALEVHRTTA